MFMSTKEALVLVPEEDTPPAVGEDKLKVSKPVKNNEACVYGRSRHFVLVSDDKIEPLSSNTAILNLPFVPLMQ